MPKRRIRRSQIMMREQLTAQQRADLSRRAQSVLVQQAWFIEAKLIALYSSIRNEVDTQQVFETAISLGKRIVFPRIDDGQMVFVEVESQSDFCLGTFGVLEPVGAKVVPVCCIDLIIVPGVAFDRSGFRIGFGKGYYDQALENRPLSCRLAGLGYAFQLEDSIPRETHDVSLDWLVTDQEILCFDSGVNL
ncbi:MAG: 5-formyltetrahydrofolate cyclo-ligase [Deltaproteobacteria bacterium]|nr:5-formyltetrahydrofolate cyclo-ligase [Deltaproteobacteria bacterium]